ncbi:hypothetical protein U879_03835 [Defluviimonas sp. 20V17]|uniref:Lambda phage tail tape-measure protein (Tape_meas_lam_C) n=1 Tax=Allgaiera indica TaxID=765699 RepID=A0AAN4UUD2_9RHOB|nr:phage tail tape measure C-terminal domain-containing protein [Allgaiera indica]KDB05004.1 hypothetical protein U879_03835 [Defluviimonas sp. 20V17]GHE05459.1 hypothetical protein GCM10008024_36320 [Allgaiera indica]SDX71686.1 Lambda phage tail tape-measure protein (Tape_meas_lam_C) [Allgaiera indica]
MAEKRVSVRLAAEGGRAVRAEMEGIGDAGARGLGRVSKEAEAANARLAAFARAAKLAFAAAAAAAVAGGVAMVKSGLQTIDVQAKLAASLGTTVASMQVLERAGGLAGVSMGEIEQAMVQLTKRLSQAASGTGPAVNALKRLHLTAEALQKLPLDARIAAIQDALAKYVPEAQRAAVASQLFGDRASVTFSRIDSATLRQATTDVRDFGVATSEADAAQIQRTNDAISRLGLVWTGLANQLTAAVAPSLEAVSNAMARATRVGGVFQRSISFLGDHLGEMASIAASFAAFFTGKFVWAMGTAALGLKGVTLGLEAVKTAMIRTGWGLLIVGVGELAYRMNLFGEAADASTAAQARMTAALDIYAQVGGPNARAEAIASTQAYLKEAAAKLATAEASLAMLRAAQAEAQARVPDGFTAGAFANDMAAREMRDAADAVARLQDELAAARAHLKELEDADPAAPLVLATGAAGSLAGALGGAVGQASALSTFLSGLPSALTGAEGKIAGIKASLATLSGGGDAAAASIAKYRAELVASLPPLETLQDGQRRFVQDAIDQKVRLFAEEQKLQAEEQKRLAALAKVTTASGGAGKAATVAAAATTTGWAAATQALADYAASTRDLGAQIGTSLVGAFQSAEEAFAAFVKTGKFGFSDLVTSILADLARVSARKFILGPIANALDGALSLVSGGDLFANIGGAAVHHAGGMVGGAAPMRQVPVMAFAGAPRMHAGGLAGLRPDEVPAILQKGERVLSRRETRDYGIGGGVTVNIQTRDAESFRQSRTQVAADIARAVALGRRGM